MTDRNTLADRIEDLLPQTQCTKCGYAGCRPYAEAVASGEAGYNQCPPGGAEGVARIASLIGKPVVPLNAANGVERARPVAIIDETLCIGCTLCIQACPVDAIVGAPKLMHTVVSKLCTGCDLCVAPCPVDCIDMVPVTGAATGWQAWSEEQAQDARQRFTQRAARLAHERDAALARAAARRSAAAPAALDASAGPAAFEGQSAAAPSDANGADSAAAKKRAIIAAALERARQKKAALASEGVVPQNVSDVSPAVQAQIDAAQARRRRLADAGAATAPTSDDNAANTPPSPSPSPSPSPIKPENPPSR
ncbi:electron transport complex subunit RsxB [Trinickia sp. LjRoot230]|uniref:electron transport complex subunit RsxB n=1 Tax=Trinickia sp. LjRoot230 TaxID=3342288 RepID=UPI003ECCD8AF